MVGRDHQPGAVVRLIRAALAVSALLLAVPPAHAGEDVPPTVVDLAAHATVRVHSDHDGRPVVRSGVVVKIDRMGRVLTSARALGCADSIQVELPFERGLLDATLVGLDDDADVAVLLIKPKKSQRPKAAELGETPAPGRTLWAWGGVSGLRSATLDTVSVGALKLRGSSRAGDIGGPIFDSAGRVVGLVGDSQGGATFGRDGGTVATADASAGTNPVDSKSLCSRRRTVWAQLTEAADYADEGNSAYALTVLQQVLERLEPGELELRVRLRRALMYVELKRFDEAIADLTTLLQLHPHHLEVRLLRSTAREAMRHWDRSLKDLDAAAASHPAELRVQGRRAVPLRELGRPAEALQAVEAWVATGEAGAADLGLRCRLQIELKKLDPAAASCLAAIEAGWARPQAFVELSTARRTSGDLPGALGALDLAVGAGVTDTTVLYNRALLRLHFGRVDEALADLDSVLATDADHGAAWHLKALAHGKQRNRPEAIAAARRAADLGADGAAELLQYFRDGGLIDEVNLF